MQIVELFHHVAPQNVAKLRYNFDIFVQFGGQYCATDFDPLASKF